MRPELRAAIIKLANAAKTPLFLLLTEERETQPVLNFAPVIEIIRSLTDAEKDELVDCNFDLILLFCLHNKSSLTDCFAQIPNFMLLNKFVQRLQLFLRTRTIVEIYQENCVKFLITLLQNINQPENTDRLSCAGKVINLLLKMPLKLSAFPLMCWLAANKGFAADTVKTVRYLSNRYVIMQNLIPCLNKNLDNRTPLIMAADANNLEFFLHFLILLPLSFDGSNSKLLSLECSIRNTLLNMLCDAEKIKQLDPVEIRELLDYLYEYTKPSVSNFLQKLLYPRFETKLFHEVLSVIDQHTWSDPDLATALNLSKYGTIHRQPNMLIMSTRPRSALVPTYVTELPTPTPTPIPSPTFAPQPNL